MRSFESEKFRLNLKKRNILRIGTILALSIFIFKLTYIYVTG